MTRDELLEEADVWLNPNVLATRTQLLAAIGRYASQIRADAATITNLTREVEELRRFRDELAKRPCDSPKSLCPSGRLHESCHYGFSDCGNCPQDQARASKAKESADVT